MSVEAVQHIRRMRGGAQSHLIRCSDGNFYVVKFRDNPQHIRVLANEMLATRLAEEAGLPVPETEVIEVSDWLVDNTPELHVQLQHHSIPCEPGKQFGSKYAADPMKAQVIDYMPVEMLGRVRNLETFAGALVFDKWTGNADGRQAVFCREHGERKYTAVFIDQGNCFNAGEWTFPDLPLRGVYPKNELYDGILGWNSFEPWLSRIDQMSESTIWDIANAIPPEWYAGKTETFHALIHTLIDRRNLTRDLISQFRQSVRNPFPRWRSAA